MSTIKEYIKENEPRFVEEWFSLLRIPSVSSQTEHKADMGRCAERWRELLLSSGADRAEVMPTDGNPVVYAERIVSPDLPTVLVYGHYDVMPAEPLELWQSEPFEPTIRDGRVYARGADDDKGQAMIQAKGFETALRAGAVHCNVKFILEGEEEVGSESLIAFCKTHGELLRADVILVSDTSMVSAETPSLTTGLRGLSYWEIEVTGPNRDLHSGHFGGAVANPINALCKLIASVTDADGRITIWGGYTGEGSKTVLPSKAYAKLSCRLVPHQDPERITRMMIDYLQAAAPTGVRVKVDFKHSGEPYVCPIDLPAYKAAEAGFTIAFGKQPLAVRRGGSIPVIPAFEKILGLKTVLMGFGLERNAIHSPNESFGLDMFRIGIEAVAEFYNHYK